MDACYPTDEDRTAGNYHGLGNDVHLVFFTGVKLFSLSLFNSEMFIATNIYVTQESIKKVSNSEIFAMEIGLDTEILKLIKYQSIQHTVFDNRQSIILENHIISYLIGFINYHTRMPLSIGTNEYD